VIYDREVTNAVSAARPLYGVVVDPALVHAIIERETGHRPYSAQGTLEPKGRGRSYGPMQVLASTAAQHGVSDPTSLSIASLGIRVGTFELARLLRLFPGDTARAIAGYNAGAGNANRDSAGRFPNQDYVDVVNGFWQRFRGALPVTAPVAAAAALVLLWLWSRGRRRRLAS
jgi:soluble lytic murein transglycosylase-like protein